MLSVLSRLSFAFAAALCGPGWAQPAPGAAGSSAPPVDASRPRVALVLSGGGARGFAHIGVLKVLERMHVPVDIVTGTSMGSIVGGAYAAGYTPSQLEKLVASTDWETIFANRAPRSELSWRRKDDDYKNLSNFEVGVRLDGPTLPQGLAGSQRLDLFLRALGGPVKDVRDLAKLPIPYAAVATDLAQGSEVVLQHDVSLSTAMRASMAVPGAFAPIEVQGHLLVDGGIVDNLPVEQARRMGADVVIAVDVGTPLLPREKLTDVIAVAEQLERILGHDSVQRSIAQLRPGPDGPDVLITPDLADNSASDFAGSGQIIAAGEAAASALQPLLARYAVDPSRYSQLEDERTRLVREDAPVRIADVRVAPLRVVNPQAVRAEVDLPEGPVTTGQIERVVQRIWGSGDFSSVSYAIVGEPAKRTLLISPYEKSWGYDTVRLGGNLSTDFREDNTYNLLLSHSWRWLDAWGAEWRNELQLGQRRRVSTEWMQPLGPGSRWYLLPHAESDTQFFDTYVGDRAVARYENVERSVELLAGRVLPGLGTAQFGWARTQLLTSEVLGSQPDKVPPSYADSWQARLRLDTLDDVDFPRSGYFVDARARAYGNTVGSAESRIDYALEADVPASVGRYGAVFTARLERAVQQSHVQFGGLFNLSGTAVGQVSGSQGALLRGVFFRNVSDAFGDLTLPIYAGLSLEAANAVPQGTRLSFGDLHHAVALFVGAASYLGPVYLAAGRTAAGHTAFYLMLGRPQ